jgi:hypothetical protein
MIGVRLNDKLADRLTGADDLELQTLEEELDKQCRGTCLSYLIASPMWDIPLAECVWLVGKPVKTGTPVAKLAEASEEVYTDLRAAGFDVAPEEVVLHHVLDVT